MSDAATQMSSHFVKDYLHCSNPTYKKKSAQKEAFLKSNSTLECSERLISIFFREAPPVPPAWICLFSIVTILIIRILILKTDLTQSESAEKGVNPYHIQIWECPPPPTPQPGPSHSSYSECKAPTFQLLLGVLVLSHLPGDAHVQPANVYIDS